MSKQINVKNGLDIHLQGASDKVLIRAPRSSDYSVVISDYIGITPKMLVKTGDIVKAGTALFFDKSNPEVLFTSPVSGVVNDVLRGDKRKILSVNITPDDTDVYENFEQLSIKESTPEQIKSLLLQSGLWTTIIQRPYGIIANLNDTPRDIFISALDTSPLNVDFDFILQDQIDNLNAAIEVLSKLTTGKIHFSGSENSTVLAKINKAERYIFKGKHPAGNVGTQISKIAPISKGEVVWTINPQHLVMIGRLVLTGKVNMEKIIALSGSEIRRPAYQRIISGAQLESIITINNLDKTSNARIISGNPLTGKHKILSDYIGFYHNQVCVLPEGDNYELLGWAMPRFKKFSSSNSYFSWLTPSREYVLDTNLNGGERAFVMTGIYERVVPMDIYPVYLLKSILAEDICKMEDLGIYEVIEEDLALCEFICPSKIEWQTILRQGINLVIKEL